jgi:bifunctional non-homologous end joining protein LigD
VPSLCRSGPTRAPHPNTHTPKNSFAAVRALHHHPVAGIANKDRLEGGTLYLQEGRGERHVQDFATRGHVPGIAYGIIIDGELTVCDDRGVPDFRALHFQRLQGGLCVWAFDLLHLNGTDLRALPLIERKAKLEKLVYKTRDNWLRFSESFRDGVKLLASCDRMGLEGIVSKRKYAPYRSGKGDWIKVKCATWREANKNRGELFKREKRR